MDLIPESPETEVGTSKKDRLALIFMNQSKRLVDGHYQLALPWKPGAPSLDYNRTIAESRLINLKKRFDKNPDLHENYVAVIHDYLEKCYAGKVDIREIESDSVKSIRVHRFDDASSGAYGTVTYLQFV